MRTLEGDLKLAIEARDAAQRTVDAIDEKRRQADAMAESLDIALAKARDAFKSASGAAAIGEVTDIHVVTARNSYRAASEAFEENTIAAEGLAERSEKADADLEEKDQEVSRLATQLAVREASQVEQEAERIAEQLGRLLWRRAQLARFASFHATNAAGGHMQEPLSGASGERTDFTRHVDELLRLQGPPVTLEDFLR